MTTTIDRTEKGTAMTTITIKTHRTKATNHDLTSAKLVIDHTEEIVGPITDEAIAEHFGPKVADWTTFGTRRSAQFCRREGTYDYITEVSIS